MGHQPQIAGYRLDAVIGRGGMGVVYRAEHVHLRRTVALKVLAPELADSEGFRERFIHEAGTAAGIDHPAIVTVYDAGESGGHLYLAMRYVEGSDLAALLGAEGRLAPERALAILEQVASALDAAHAHGLVHRDVKPANVLLQGDRAFLTDFGLTKKMTGRTAFTATGQFVGTIDYIAPEQVRGGDVSARTDVYALGCVLYQCLTGARPFHRDSEVAVLYAHLEEPPPRPSEHGLPAPLDGVIARALAKRPGERQVSCSALIAEARAALAPAAPAETTAPAVTAPASAPPVAQPTIAAGPPTTPTRALPEDRGRRRSRFALGGGVGAAAAVAAVVAVVALGGGGDDAEPAREPDAAPSQGERAPELEPAGAPPIAVGSEPRGVAVRAGAVWVTNSGDGTVSRIDERGRRVTATVPVGERPEGISAGQGSVWVANRGSGTVSRIDASSGRAGEPIGVGSDPRAIGTTPTSVWVANAGDDTLTRIDVARGEAGPPLPAGDEPVAIAIRDGVLWVANAGDGTVVRLDNRSGEPLSDPIRVGGRPSAVWVGERFAWVADEDSGTVRHIDPDDGRLVGPPVRVGDAPVALRTGGDGICWVVSRDGTVTPVEV